MKQNGYYETLPTLKINSLGSFKLQGRVEVRKNGIWGSVCQDNTDEYNWGGTADQTVDDRAAEVICRQMGYTVGRLVELSIVPDGTDQIWMDNLNCSVWPSNLSFWQNEEWINSSTRWMTPGT
jgi:hypothetical protein